MKYLIIIFAFISPYCYSANQLGIGLTGGIHTPVADNEYNDAALSNTGFLFGGHIEYNPHKSWGLQLTHARYEMKESPVSPVVTDLLVKFRMTHEETGAVHLGLGAGASTFHNKESSDLHLSLRGKVGAEFFFAKDFQLDAGVNFIWIKDHGDEHVADVILLSPQIALTWFVL